MFLTKKDNYFKYLSLILILTFSYGNANSDKNSSHKFVRKGKIIFNLK